MEKTNKTHFCFDLDDTLTDSYNFNQQMFLKTFEPYYDLKLNLPAENFLRDFHSRNKGSSMTAQFQTAIDYLKLEIEPGKLVRENEELHIMSTDNIRMFDGARDFIRDLTLSGKKASLISNRQTASLMKILNKFELPAILNSIISCGDAGHEKPDPYCMLELIRSSNTPKEEFLYFGDSQTDIEFATAAGVDYLIVDHYQNSQFYLTMRQAFL